jgi:hypothetical protein
VAKQILLQDVRKTLILPGKAVSITPPAFYNLLARLDIKPEQKMVGQYRRAFLTEPQAKLVEEEFRRVHWRKFSGRPSKKSNR